MNLNSYSIEELKKISKPSHIAIIMDGNGRWALSQNKPRVFGHSQGVKVVEKITEFCAKIGIKILTLYSFSTENWKRPKEEVNFLMQLFEEYMISKADELTKNNIKFNVMGRINELPKSVTNAIYKTQEKTAHCNGMILNLAVNYSGRAEIIDAIKKISYDILKKINLQNLSRELNNNSTIDIIEQINEEYVKNFLYTQFEYPDLVIRTSNEMRISNFMLWQIAYSELYIVKKYWPEFNELDLIEAIYEFNRRERRFGALK